MVTRSDIAEDWSHVHNPASPIIIENRAQPLTGREILPLLDKAPFTVRAEGDLDSILVQLAELPDTLRADIAALAQRFMDLMQVVAVRVRFEGVTTNACKKVHADYTDVRLISTYFGPGTDYAPHGMTNEGVNCCLERVPTGAIALFKGRTYALDHPPCFHRSPPIADIGEKRLVLVIDTPLKENLPD